LPGKKGKTNRKLESKMRKKEKKRRRQVMKSNSKRRQMMMMKIFGFKQMKSLELPTRPSTMAKAGMQAQAYQRS